MSKDEKEKWVFIKDTENLYIISNFGRVFKKYKKRDKIQEVAYETKKTGVVYIRVQQNRTYSQKTLYKLLNSHFETVYTFRENLSTCPFEFFETESIKEVSKRKTTMLDDLKCCGNCIVFNNDTNKCEHKRGFIDYDCYCPRWHFDGLAQKQRIASVIFSK